MEQKQFGRYVIVSELGRGANQGDLTHTFTGTLAETHPSFGVLAKYNLNDYIALDAHFLYGEVSGRDEQALEADLRKRDLSFRSNIYEVGAQAEFNILGYQPYALSRPFSPYLFLGVAGFKFNPQTRYGGDWVDLQPLGKTSIFITIIIKLDI